MPASPMTGSIPLKPVVIGSSSPRLPQNLSFTVQSSQSDERVESEKGDEDDTIVLQSKSDPQLGRSDSHKAANFKVEELNSDDDVLFEDADTILKRFQPKSRLPTPPTTVSARSKRNAAFKGSYDVPQTFEKLLNNPPPTDSTPSRAVPDLKFKFSLAKLVKLHQKDERAKTAMGRAEDALKEESEEDDVDPGMDLQIYEDLVKDNNGGENVERLARVMARADVLKSEMAYHFFESRLRVDEDHVSSFPNLNGGSGNDDDTLLDPLIQDDTRVHAVLTGYALEVIRSRCLSEDKLKKFSQWLYSAGNGVGRFGLLHF